MDPQPPIPPQAPLPVSNEPPAPTANVTSEVASALQNGKNVLVTVSTNPSVDELASALGLTFLLGKLGKHATAVFSGKIPPAMEFLDPEKTFENTVDSLRDFIIALDKEKADKLRYKVEDEVVKVFITPYKTVISEKDLQFSQGDFNVDVVIALGVEKREELDKAIIAHGRILHDAAVITVNAGNKTSGLGSIDWREPEASSVAEMLVALSDLLGSNSLDGQISTAFLTGIVAETNRFSNEKTSPKVMSLSAQLMAAGANQQLIATNLRQEGMISEPVRKKEAGQPHDDDGEMVLDHAEGESKEQDLKAKSDVETESPGKAKPRKTPTEKAPVPTTGKPKPKEEIPDVQPKAAPGKAAESLKEGLEQSVEIKDQAKEEEKPIAVPPVPNQPASPEAVGSADTPVPAAAGQPPEISPPAPVQPVAPPPITPALQHTPMDKPTFGGTLNATTAVAEEDKIKQQEREAEVNNLALSHDEGLQSDAAVEEARQAVEDANIAEPFNPANQPLQSINAEPLPTAEPSPAIDTGVSAMQESTPPPPPEPPEPSPVDAFMQPHSDSTTALPPLNAPAAASPPPLPGAQPASDSGFPPLPPLPGTPTSDGGLPPLPPLPGQPASDPAAVTQPQINPSFMQNMPQSQNPWTDAGDDLAAQQSGKDAARQEKMDKMGQQYDQAVDRNRELQGLPPLNDPNGSGLPPLPPV